MDSQPEVKDMVKLFERIQNTQALENGRQRAKSEISGGQPAKLVNNIFLKNDQKKKQSRHLATIADKENYQTAEEAHKKP